MFHLKTTLVTSILALSVSATIAEARITTTQISCRQAQDIVHDRGAIVMNTGPRTYDRFVADRSFCPFGDYVKRAYVPTRDRQSCSIGYICTVDNPREKWPNRWDD